MNRYSAYPQPVPGGFRVMMRFARDSHPKPLMAEGDKPAIFATESAAWKACAHHLLQYLNFPIVGGECEGTPTIRQARKSAADRLFRKGKEIQIERIGA